MRPGGVMLGVPVLLAVLTGCGLAGGGDREPGPKNSQRCKEARSTYTAHEQGLDEAGRSLPSPIPHVSMMTAEQRNTFDAALAGMRTMSDLVMRSQDCFTATEVTVAMVWLDRMNRLEQDH